MITGKKLLTLLVLSVLLIGTLVACSLDRGGTTGSTSATGGSSGVEVHMKGVEFIPNSITIKKGQSIKLIDDDTFTSHIISNGTWENNQEKSEREPNAPTVDHMQISGGSTGNVGPFNATGTFKLYCTIHAGMKLTIIVQ